MDSVSECIKLNETERLNKRREDLDYNFLKRVEFGLYDIDLDDFINFDNSYQTCHGTVNPHFGHS